MRIRAPRDRNLVHLAGQTRPTKWIFRPARYTVDGCYSFRPGSLIEFHSNPINFAQFRSNPFNFVQFRSISLNSFQFRSISLKSVQFRSNPLNFAQFRSISLCAAQCPQIGVFSKFDVRPRPRLRALENVKFGTGKTNVFSNVRL